MAGAVTTERIDRPGRPRRETRPLGYGVAIATAAVLAVAVFAFYFAAYPVRHLPLPMGFDPPWYVWRTQYLASQGLGTGLRAARPGYPLLSALLGSATGRSQLRLTAILSLALVPVLALAVAAFARWALGMSRSQALVVVAVTGAVLGPTHLVGENLSNLLNLLLVVAASAALARRVDGRPGLAGAIGLLVAGGLAHWDFLAVFGAMLFLAFLAAVPSSRRALRRGVPVLETEAGVLGVAGTVTGAAMLALITGVLRSPLRTEQIAPDPLLFQRKFTTDIVRLVVPAVAGVLAVPLLVLGLPRRPSVPPPRQDADGDGRAPRWLTGPPCRRFAIRLLAAWTLVCLAGIVAGEVSFAVPPARFLALLVAVPGALAVSAVLVFVGRRLGRAAVSAASGSSRHRAVEGLVIAVAVVALGVPGALRWFRYPMLMQPEGLRQAETAAAYIRTLPPRRPFVFLVSYVGVPSTYQSVVKERTIRIALPPQRQPDMYEYVGTPSNLLAGVRTRPPDPRTDNLTRPYWLQVRTVLRSAPPVIVLRAFGPAEFDQALAMGGRLIGPDVALLRGTPPAEPLSRAPPVDAVPSFAGGVAWGIVVLGLLWLAGAGWTVAAFGRTGPVDVLALMAPAVGAGALILGGLVAAEAGVRLHGAGGAATYAIIAAAGFGAARLSGRWRR